MSDFIKTISFSTLIDMVLQHALKCPSEKVFMLVMDCCASRYSEQLQRRRVGSNGLVGR